MHLILPLGFKGYLSTQPGCLNDLFKAAGLWGLERREMVTGLQCLLGKPHSGQRGSRIVPYKMPTSNGRSSRCVFWALLCAKCLPHYFTVFTTGRDYIAFSCTTEKSEVCKKLNVFPQIAEQINWQIWDGWHSPSLFNNFVIVFEGKTKW